MERRIPEPLDGLGVLVRRRFLLGLAGGSAFDNEPRNFHQSSKARQQIALRAGAGAGVREHSHLSIWTSGLTPSHRLERRDPSLRPPHVDCRNRYHGLYSCCDRLPYHITTQCCVLGRDDVLPPLSFLPS